MRQVDVRKASNPLDRWIAASARSLTLFVHQEMAAYRLYTVVPRLVQFIGDLTNVYVRYNRKRLKGGKSPEDCLLALTSLYDVLMILCKVSTNSKYPCLSFSASFDGSCHLGAADNELLVSRPSHLYTCCLSLKCSLSSPLGLCSVSMLCLARSLR